MPVFSHAYCTVLAQAIQPHYTQSTSTEKQVYGLTFSPAPLSVNSLSIIKPWLHIHTAGELCIQFTNQFPSVQSVRRWESDLQHQLQNSAEPYIQNYRKLHDKIYRYMSSLRNRDTARRHSTSEVFEHVKEQSIHYFSISAQEGRPWDKDWRIVVKLFGIRLCIFHMPPAQLWTVQLNLSEKRMILPWLQETWSRAICLKMNKQRGYSEGATEADQSFLTLVSCNCPQFGVKGRPWPRKVKRGWRGSSSVQLTWVSVGRSPTIDFPVSSLINDSLKLSVLCFAPLSKMLFNSSLIFSWHWVWNLSYWKANFAGIWGKKMLTVRGDMVFANIEIMSNKIFSCWALEKLSPGIS